MQDYIKVQFEPRLTALPDNTIQTFWSSLVMKSPFDYTVSFESVKRDEDVTDGGKRVKKVSGLSLVVTMLYRRIATELDTVNHIEKLVRSNSMRVRFYLNPNISPDKFLEGYLEPKVNITDVWGTIKGTSNKAILKFTAQSPGPASSTNILEYL